MSESASERQFAAVETELNRERAATLRRVATQVEEAADRCTELLERLAQAETPADHEAVRERYRAARTAFEHARRQFCLQREAIGLHDHRWVDRIYPTPPAV